MFLFSWLDYIYNSICFSRNECLLFPYLQNHEIPFGEKHVFTHTHWAELVWEFVAYRATIPRKNSVWFEGEVITGLAAVTSRRPAYQWPNWSKESCTVQSLRYLSTIYPAQPALQKLTQQFVYGESLYLYLRVCNKLLFSSPSLYT